ncbi:hypothetical protein SELMODRAFT_427257 [Selaginella moellendorffii]|uniref:Mesoderm development candidate 2 n=1 Tax=Selaginella moellendorffii TaxID=88036 RepID=D8SZ11_SELML|nr:uncharacterized protein LOC9638864 [Selaginella moellendorffii]EFJ10320.1 hypothetical protein SELMODRAFT_427257 [Selaginella moellendorffii]|eukprot:XP_002988524.1 uncharacterized protein LOC9638864 [Selaginella moellendorffii]
MARRLLVAMIQLLVIAAVAKKVRIPDHLDDVVDDEEDEEWKMWGKKAVSKPVFDPPPDFTGMTPDQIQAEMMKRHIGPAMGFVKLRLDVPRSKEELPELAKKWSRLLRTGGIGARVTAVDLNTLMFTLDSGKETTELKDFFLRQPEAYEVKIGQQAFRRPGDPPLEVVIEKRKLAKERKQEPNDEL